MKLLLAVAICLFTLTIHAQSPSPNAFKNQRGAAGPAWGPYSTRYAGIAHVADSARGLRFDFTVFLSQYLGKMVVPNVKFESDWYPWNASPDLNYFSFREELEWKDQVFADISFAKLDDHKRLMKIIITNNTSNLQSLALHFMAGLAYPNNASTSAFLPSGRKWLSAIDYAQMYYAKPRPDDNLITDGLLKGEARDNNFVGGSGLGNGFGGKGDRVVYHLSASQDLVNGILLLRYKFPEGKKTVFKAEGLVSGEIELTGTGNFAIQTVKIGAVKKGIQNLTLNALTSTPIELDGFSLMKENELPQVRFEILAKRPVPVLEQPFPKTVLLKYPDVPQYYGLVWNDSTDYKVREFFTDELDNAARTVANDVVYPQYYSRKKEHTTDIYLRAVQMAAKSKKTLYAVLMDGSRDEVTQGLRPFPSGSVIEKKFGNYSDTASARANPAGNVYAFGNKMLKATELQNIVYPVYTQRQFTKQFVPGKRWSNLYTWDNGFIGIGMASVDIKRAIESLQVYTTDSASTNAYTHHGSLLPIQFFLYKEIWDKTQSKELLAYFYPRMKKYYRFFCGEYGSSTTRKLSSGLLNTFDYFYNSGGWDDYPAQVYMHSQKLSGLTAPAISSSIAIRMAKIMSYAATMLNLDEDLPAYQKDINLFTNALQKYSWDEASGYFGYVLHDKNSGRPTGILRTEKGINYNMGVDGIYPLVAGICTPVQRQVALKNLFLDKACWTDIGISAVDQSAPYFSLQGYWNGAVWFPHQWILWKTMLDEGEAGRASQIALTALKLYNKEVDSSYFTAEIFRIDTKRGNGWKQFGALSSPILSWYSAYFQPGTITTGFDTWVTGKTSSTNQRTLNATVHLTASVAKKPCMLICMPQSKSYTVFINGKTAVYKEVVPGCLEVQIGNTAKSNVALTVKAL